MKQWDVASPPSLLYWTSPELGHCGRLDTTLSWRIQIRLDLWHSKDNSEDYFIAEFQILKSHNHRDNPTPISSSSKASKRCVLFFPKCINLVWKISLKWFQGPIEHIFQYLVLKGLIKIIPYPLSPQKSIIWCMKWNNCSMRYQNYGTKCNKFRSYEEQPKRT